MRLPRLPRSPMGTGIGDLIFFTAWFGFVLLWIALVGWSAVQQVDTRLHGVRTTAVAVSSRSEVWHDEDGVTRRWYTVVDYSVAGRSFREEVSGGYDPGDEVAVVYDPAAPQHVVSADSISTFGLVVTLVMVGFGVAMLVFGVGFVRDWYSW